MSGNIALLSLPNDQRLHIQLSTYFHASTLAKVRRDIQGNRSGIAVIELATPITAPLIEFAMDRHATWLLGFRRAGTKRWWAFKERDKPLPVLPGGPSHWMGLTGSYTELGLPPSINMRPDKLLNLLAGFEGGPDPQFCRAIVLMLFLVAESLRFDSVLMECARYFSISNYTIHPEAFEPIVHNWKKSLPGNPDLLISHLD